MAKSPDRQYGKSGLFSQGDNSLFSERFVEEMRAPLTIGVGLMPFDTAVRALKEREFRRHVLQDAATKLAGRLGDYIEDKEGWHGEARRETIRDVERRG